ncbi:hypothetical protein [Allofrancisella frigidaquae]|uniref:DUF3573 domain-containing protein n=1 Tax=Allofrancisella frigidaquae TaxID=1085644 RepID=A0A6M3HTD8_9GAMM|nr:hypothetical protein [Allofrancisella frigidaquae]QIV94445.1 hypothetical protein E3E15_03355 [Allofrancisella frigidaquae]
MKKLFLIIGMLVFSSLVYAANNPSDNNQKSQLTEDQSSIENKSVIDVIEQQEGEAFVPTTSVDIGKTILDYTRLNTIKLPYYQAIDNNVIFSQAMMNTQQETADPLFIMLSRQNGLLKDDYLYAGGTASFLPMWGRNNTSNQNSTSINNYNFEYYMLSTLGDWTSVFASVNIYTDNGDWNVNPGGIYFLLGDLKRLPVFTYAALSTVNFGNFDETTNFIPTLTRIYFMQSGGNVNLSYNNDGLQANVVFLAPSQNQFLQVANAYNGNAKLGFSVNMKYTYDLNTVGDYWYFGSAYSNVSGFTNKSNDNIGVVDFNFGISVSDLEFMSEFIFTDKGVDKTTDVSGSFNLKEVFYTSLFPNLNTNNFLSSGGQVYSWSSQLNYTTRFYNKDLVPYVSYSQLQQSSTNYAVIIDTGFRYNTFADAWLGFSYSYINAQANKSFQQDNLLSLYLRIFI